MELGTMELAAIAAVAGVAIGVVLVLTRKSG
jgi:hypothetical protein